MEDRHPEFYAYINKFNNNDILKLGEYCIDKIYRHDSTKQKSEDFGLNLIDINKYNKLYESQDRVLSTNGSGHTSNAYNDLLLYKFLSTKRIKIYSRISGNYDNGRREWSVAPIETCKPEDILSYIFNYTSHRVHDGFTLDKIGYSKIYFTPISINTEFDKQQYINYFITEDFNCNKLKQLLKMLTSDQLALNDALIKSSIPTENSIPHPISEDTLKYNSLLQKYCIELIIICKTYTFEQSHKDDVELKFDFPL
jgi:hypothetical protein